MSERVVWPIWAEEDGTVLGYMCLVAWELEIGGAMGGNRVYPSIEDIKANSGCWKDCGIVEVRVSFSRVISPPSGD